MLLLITGNYCTFLKYFRFQLALAQHQKALAETECRHLATQTGSLQEVLDRQNRVFKSRNGYTEGFEHPIVQHSRTNEQLYRNLETELERRLNEIKALQKQ